MATVEQGEKLKHALESTLTDLWAYGGRTAMTLSDLEYFRGVCIREGCVEVLRKLCPGDLPV